VGMSDPVQTIEIYDFKEKHVRIPRGWELRVEGRFAKLATKLWDYFRKKGLIVQSYMNDVRIERVRVHGGELMDNIMSQYEGSLFRDHDPEMVIVGRDTFRKMMGIRELHDYCGGPLSFNAIGERYHAGDPRDPTARPTKTMFNLPVRVVSNMEGMVILDRGR
jgi:hypothetical protein